MKIEKQTLARDFNATTIEGLPFSLSQLKGRKILLSFYRNGACALCNLRIHEVIQNYSRLREAGVEVVAVFESSVEDMSPFVGQQNAPFPMLADPGAELYTLYGVESSPEKINNVMTSGVAHARIAEAAAQGFQLIQQAGANFFRLPADFLIDKDFEIVRWHYSDFVIDHLPLEEIISDKEVENK